MKLEDFLTHVEAANIDWVIDAYGSIGERGEDHCPIWALYFRSNFDDDDPEDVFAAGRLLGLTELQLRRFMAAADNRPPYDATIRHRLLALVERKETP